MHQIPSALTIAVSGLARGEIPQPGSAVIASLRRQYPVVKIVGLCYDALESGLFAQGLDRVDVACLLPFPTKGPQVLLDRLDEIHAKHPLDIIIPCYDSELQNYLLLADELKARNIRGPLLTQHAFDQRRKDRLSQLGAKLQIPVPKTIVVANLSHCYAACAEIGYPLMLKGSMYGATRVNSPADMAYVYNALLATWGSHGPILAQAMVWGDDEYSIMGLGDGKGKLLGSCQLRKVIPTATGKTYLAIVIADPALQQIAEKLVKHLRWWGPFEMEFVKGARGHELIEFNPRFPACIDFPSQLGCNFPALVAAMLDSRLPKPTLLPCAPGKMFMRHALDLAGDLEQIAELVSRGEIALSSAQKLQADLVG